MKSNGHHTTDLMLGCLRDRGDKLCDDAATEIEWLHEYVKKLESRIHNQRVALRENWQIVEQRAQYRRAWYPSKLLSAILGNRRADGQVAREK